MVLFAVIGNTIANNHFASNERMYIKLDKIQLSAQNRRDKLNPRISSFGDNVKLLEL